MLSSLSSYGLCENFPSGSAVDDAAEPVDVGGSRLAGLVDVVHAEAPAHPLVAVTVDVPSHDA